MKFVLLVGFSQAMAEHASFVISLDGTCQPMCALDTPSTVVRINQSSFPSSALCSWQCKSTTNCASFNIKDSPDGNFTCELYFKYPQRCQNVSNCTLFTVSSRIEAFFATTLNH